MPFFWINFSYFGHWKLHMRGLDREINSTGMYFCAAKIMCQLGYTLVSFQVVCLFKASALRHCKTRKTTTSCMLKVHGLTCAKKKENHGTQHFMCHMTHVNDSQANEKQGPTSHVDGGS
jgi:hypothetical protein